MYTWLLWEFECIRSVLFKLCLLSQNPWDNMRSAILGVDLFETLPFVAEMQHHKSCSLSIGKILLPSQPSTIGSTNLPSDLRLVAFDLSCIQSTSLKCVDTFEVRNCFLPSKCFTTHHFVFLWCEQLLYF